MEIENFNIDVCLFTGIKKTDIPYGYNIVYSFLD